MGTPSVDRQMDGQTRVKTLPSRRTTYAGGNKKNKIWWPLVYESNAQFTELVIVGEICKETFVNAQNLQTCKDSSADWLLDSWTRDQ